jgi:hypothetical protein
MTPEEAIAWVTRFHEKIDELLTANRLVPIEAMSLPELIAFGCARMRGRIGFKHTRDSLLAALRLNKHYCATPLEFGEVVDKAKFLTAPDLIEHFIRDEMRDRHRE